MYRLQKIVSRLLICAALLANAQSDALAQPQTPSPLSWGSVPYQEPQDPFDCESDPSCYWAAFQEASNGEISDEEVKRILGELLTELSITPTVPPTVQPDGEGVTVRFQLGTGAEQTNFDVTVTTQPEPDDSGLSGEVTREMTSGSNSETWTIELMTGNMEEAIEGAVSIDGIEGLSEVMSTLYHELLHFCLDLPDEGDYDPDSCSHFLIGYLEGELVC